MVACARRRVQPADHFTAGSLQVTGGSPIAVIQIRDPGLGTSRRCSASTVPESSSAQAVMSRL